MKFFTVIATTMVAGFLAVAAQAASPVPRPAKELTVLEPSGKQTLLSSFKGKVVVVEFLFTTCPHCQNAAKMFTKIQKDAGPRGFQALGIAFDDANAQKVQGFVQQYGVGYPVGYASRDTVMSYLGLSVMDRFVVPQVIVIDKKGVIRAQSEPMGSPNLQDETYIRGMIDGLLKEPTATVSSTAPAAKKK